MRKRPQAVELGLRALKQLIRHIYSEAARTGDFLSPDAAMDRLDQRLVRLLEGEPASDAVSTTAELLLLTPRVGDRTLQRKVHHFAVDFFYSTYFPQKGAPKLPEANLKTLLRLRAEGLSYGKIALKLKLPSDLQTKDRIRKQIAIGKRRKFTPQPD